MREYDIRSELLDMGWSILQDRDVPQTYPNESFEDRSGEGFHVNSSRSDSLFLCLSKIECCRHALMLTPRRPLVCF